MKTIKLIIKFIFLIFFAAISASAFVAACIYSPWTPTDKKDLKRLKKILHVNKNDIVYDLGCGDGRLCVYLAKNTNAKKIIGIELSFIYYLIAKCKVYFYHLNDRVQIQWGDVFYKNLHEASKIFFYFTPKTAEKLKTKLYQELSRGVKVASYVYPINGWMHDSVDQENEKQRPIYIYTMNEQMHSVIFDH